MDLNEIVAQQTNTGSLICRFLANLKKLGQDKLTFYICESRLKLLEEYWAKFSNRHEEAVILPKFSGTQYAKTDYFQTVEDKYIEAQAYIREQMEKLTSTSPQNKDPPSPALVSAKLPKLTLPTFSGNYLEWESFKDLFTSLVHNNKALSDATRLQYLKAQLSGDAAKLISNIPVTDANYAGAWKDLTERYDNKRILVNHHFNHLLSLKPLTTEFAHGLRRLLDITTETRRALENLGRPVEHWDDWFVHLTVKKLDASTRKDWETSVGGRNTMPSWDELSTFLVSRTHALEAVETPEVLSKSNRSLPAGKFRTSVRNNLVKVTRNEAQGCSLCNEHHYIGYCKSFKQKTPQQRKEEAIRLNLCLNCLKRHQGSPCPSPYRCSICKGHHHSLLHEESSTSTSEPVLSAHSTTFASNYTLLATALVRVRGSNGRSAVVRTLLDQGSEATFMTENLAQYLRLPRSKVTVPVIGMGSVNCGTAKSIVKVQLTSILDDYNTTLNATVLVLPNLLKTFQPRRVDTRQWSHLRNLSFADPQPHKPMNVELVIGADLYGHALLEGLIKGPPGTPIAQQTLFGWVLSGAISDVTSEESSTVVTNMHCSVDLRLSDDLRRFWEIEEVPSVKQLTPEEEFCEDHFKLTHTRDTNGKFVVCLPRRPDVSLGESYSTACKSFYRNESTRQRNPKVNTAYQTFMQEYIELGHMKPICDKTPPAESFYLPHHGVWKQEGINSKIRVVFNASAPSKSGKSLNDLLLPGPKLQQDLSHILLRWRKYEIAFSADIVRMFRQIWVNPKDQPLQRILWRNSASEELQEFQLQTVTYGTACAPFLAIRCLLQLASEEASRYPKASDTVRQQMYVDDILAGADTLEEALELRFQLEGLLMAGGFELAKWSSNVTDLAPNSACNHFGSDGSVKTLGIHWNPEKDIFGFQVQLDNAKPITKRSILSCIARLFDPLGWLAPVLITAKVFIQDLWSVKVGWDAQLPKELEEAWSDYYLSLQQLQDVRIPRWIQIQAQSSCEVHGFCDASLRAYAAVVYLRVANPDGTFHTKLLAAKTKVAPLRIISLPRLELSGAVLLIRLLKNICEALQLSSPPCVHAWTDSQVVLHWINAVPARWKCFVANRVSEIHQTLPQTIWHHISGCDNPVDPASRGIPASSLKDHSLWWHGPAWLRSESWPESNIAALSPEALKEQNLKMHAFTANLPATWNLSDRYSSLTQLSPSPQDLLPLTPGHFLIGSPLTTIPEPSLAPRNVHRLTRWQLLRRLSEEFWRRWSKEYIRQLQARQKWATQTLNFEPGDLVLIKEDNLPPSKWHLGRILQTHPGDDGIVRVVTVRTATSTYRRPVAKLCKLPVQ